MTHLSLLRGALLAAVVALVASSLLVTMAL